MKKLLISLVVFSVLFAIGCQENSITDPISIESINKNQTTGETVIRGSIPLDGILVLPGLANNYFSIEGRINYTHELVLVDPIPPAPQYYININLSVSAVLTNVFQSGHNTWTISSESQDVVYVPRFGFYLLEKSFPVLGRNDGMVLVCRFLVTINGVSLDAKWLAFSDDHGINKVSGQQDPLTLPPVEVIYLQQ